MQNPELDTSSFLANHRRSLKALVATGVAVIALAGCSNDKPPTPAPTGVSQRSIPPAEVGGDAGALSCERVSDPNTDATICQPAP